MRLAFSIEPQYQKRHRRIYPKPNAYHINLEHKKQHAPHRDSHRDKQQR